MFHHWSRNSPLHLDFGDTLSHFAYRYHDKEQAYQCIFPNRHHNIHDRNCCSNTMNLQDIYYDIHYQYRMLVYWDRNILLYICKAVHPHNIFHLQTVLLHYRHMLEWLHRNMYSLHRIHCIQDRRNKNKRKPWQDRRQCKRRRVWMLVLQILCHLA